jgi:hypothetical protein
MGNIGIGDTTDVYINTPRQVNGLTNVIAVAACYTHSLALLGDGSVWEWGGTNPELFVPNRVSGISGISAIAGGTDHDLAIDRNGTVWAWGSNSYGQLGNGTETASALPVKVQGLTGAIAVAGSDGSSLALKADGTAWAWGQNSLSLSPPTYCKPCAVPVQVSGLVSVVSIAAGFDWNLAVIGTPLTVDVFIGGLLDGEYRNVLDYYNNVFLPQHPNTMTFMSKYFSYDETSPDGGPSLSPYLAALPSGTTINLIGHSYGGDTAVNLAASSGRPINLLITIDPVGGRSDPTYPTAYPPRRAPSFPWSSRLIKKFRALKTNTATWIDVDAQPSADDASDIVALLGGKYDELPNTPVKYDTLFIGAIGEHHSQFSDMMILPGTDGKSAQDILLGH